VIGTKKKIAEHTACITEVISLRWITNCASLAKCQYELRPCHSSFCEEAELHHGKVGRERYSFALLANNAHTDVRHLDHAGIVPAIPDAADPLFRVVADETHYVRLLHWGTTVGHDGGQFSGDFDELVLEEVQTKLQFVVSHFKLIYFFYEVPARIHRQ
jgi:hypothetical protein